MTVPTLLLTGPVGVGKTTVGLEAGDVLVERGVAHAFADMDAFSQVHLRPPDDRFGSRVAFAGRSGGVRTIALEALAHAGWL